MTDYSDDDKIEPKQTVQETVKTDIDVDKLVKLSMKLNIKCLNSSSFVDRTFPMLTTLAVGKTEGSHRAPVDLVCVIDHSGSMAGEKIELVKGSFDYLLEYLNEDDRLSIVIFDDRVARLTPLLRMTQKNKEKTLRVLKPVSGEGGTNIDLGLRKAFQILKCRRYFNPVTSIFLLSDGLDNGAQARVKKSLEEFNIQESFTIHCFGFGNDHDPKLMTDISDLKDGNFYFIEKLDTVDECFVSCLGSLISAVAKNVEIRIRAHDSQVLTGVRIAKAYGDASMWDKDGDAYLTKIAQLVTGKSKNYVLDIVIPKNSKELADHEKHIKIASAEAIITDLSGNKITKQAELELYLLNETESAKEEEPDKEVLTHYYRVRGADVLSEARGLADKGKYEDAQKVLKNFKEELSGCPIKSEQFIINLIEDIDQAIRDTRPQEYKYRGRINMFGIMRAQYQEKAYLQSANVYMNDAEQTFLSSIKSRKAMKSQKSL